MRKTLATIGLVAALAALAPIAAEAGRNMRGPHSRGHSTHSYRPRPHVYPYYFRPHYRPYYYRPYYYRPYYYSSFSYVPPAYAVTPGYVYSAPPGYSSMPPVPQIEREVVFPEGRYLLEGDGDAVPYRWVWVPNPPTAPPADAPDPR
jgi:hypothetical protein